MKTSKWGIIARQKRNEETARQTSNNDWVFSTALQVPDDDIRVQSTCSQMTIVRAPCHAVHLGCVECPLLLRHGLEVFLDGIGDHLWTEQIRMKGWRISSTHLTTTVSSREVLAIRRECSTCDWRCVCQNCLLWQRRSRQRINMHLGILKTSDKRWGSSLNVRRKKMRTSFQRL